MEHNWIKKVRVLSISLVISGALNIGLLAAFIAFQLQGEGDPLARLSSSKEEKRLSNPSLLESMSKLSFRELVSLLTNRELIEEGYSKRDLALSALVAFHHFNLEKALSGLSLQRRSVLAGGQTVELFPGLSDEAFEGIIRYAYQEKWPLTAKGLFALMQKNISDDTLAQTFFLTPEFYALKVLFQKTEAPQEPSALLQLVLEGSWELLDSFAKEQTQLLDLSVEKRRRLLLSYLAHKSAAAGALLLKTDFVFVQKRLDDRGILDLVNLIDPKSEESLRFFRSLIESPRSDAIRKLAFEKTGGEIPVVVQAPAAPAPVAAVVEAKYHTVEPGESLWKIAREHKVKVEDIVLLNGIDQGKIFPGMTLKIPD